MSRRETTDATAGEPLGGLTWYRVKLDEDLEENDEADCTITVPDGEFGWRETSRKIYKVKNGLPHGGTIDEGQHAWVHQYYGRWVVVIPEC